MRGLGYDVVLLGSSVWEDGQDASPVILPGSLKFCLFVCFLLLLTYYFLIKESIQAALKWHHSAFFFF